MSLGGLNQAPPPVIGLKELLPTPKSRRPALLTLIWMTGVCPNGMKDNMLERPSCPGRKEKRVRSKLILKKGPNFLRDFRIAFLLIDPLRLPKH